MDPQQLFARFKALTSSFSTTQLVTLVGAFVLVAGIVGGSAWWLNAPNYVLLFSDMDAESAGQVITRLKSMNVPYQLDEGGRGIRVPSTRVDELRIDLSSQNLPASGRVGFELFDRTQFGATQFLEQINYRRALEGEIARTISSIQEVATARVHIAMGKDSLFGEPSPAKASVVLRLRGSRQPSASTIAGIGNLVASSVEGLRPEAVVILDSFGRPLARPEGDANDPRGAAAMERQQRIERDMAARVVALLEPVVGPDRVRVNVAVTLDAETREETEERWDPNTVVRSRQLTADQSGGGGLAMAAGSRGNTAPPPADGKAPAAPQQVMGSTGPSRSAETTNYEVSRTTRHVIAPPGDVTRLSVAVILDDDQVSKKNADGSTGVTRKPRSRDELQKIQGLVAAAVGLEATRGDKLTVENVAFDEPVTEEGPPPTMLEKITPAVWEGSRIAMVGLVGLFALMMIVRPMMRKAGVAPAAKSEALAAAVSAPQIPMVATASGPRTVADLESEIDAELNALSAQYSENRRLPVLTRRVSAVTVNEPENVAKLLRSWIADEAR